MESPPSEKHPWTTATPEGVDQPAVRQLGAIVADKADRYVFIVEY